MERSSGRFYCALLLAVLCMAPLAASKAFGDTNHFALSVEQAKVLAHLAFLFRECGGCSPGAAWEFLSLLLGWR